MKKSDIYRKLMRFLTVLGGAIGIFIVFLKLYKIENVELWILNLGISNLIFINCGYLIAGFTLITALKPNKPLPWHWISLGILALLNFFFVHFFPACLVFVSGILELIKRL